MALNFTRNALLKARRYPLRLPKSVLAVPWRVLALQPAPLATFTHHQRDQSLPAVGRSAGGVLQSRSSAPPRGTPGKGSARRGQPPPVQKVTVKGQDAASEFFSPAGTTFASLGLSAEVVESIERAGFMQPSRLQEMAVPHLLTRRDIVLAAETGSGKTLAYLGAVASQLLAHRQLQQQAQQEEQLPGRLGVRRSIAVVLCPNSTLCGQVVAMAAALKGPDGAQLLRVAQVSTAMPPPFEPLDVVVSTPGALWSLVAESGRHYGWGWTQEGLAAHTRHLVVDEADLLTVGGYARDLQRILELFKVEQRRTMEAQLMWQLQMPEEGFDRLNRNLKKACWEGGLAAMQAQGFSPPSQPRPLPPGAFTSRQHIFVAATMPDLTKGDVGTGLRKNFPEAVWLQGAALHQSPAKVAHQWVWVEGEEERRQALLAAVRGDPDYAAGRGKLLVFVKDGPSADAVAAMLQEHGIEARAYHAGLPVDGRRQALDLFRTHTTTTATTSATTATTATTTTSAATTTPATTATTTTFATPATPATTATTTTSATTATTALSSSSDSDSATDAPEAQSQTLAAQAGSSAATAGVAGSSQGSSDEDGSVFGDAARQRSHQDASSSSSTTTSSSNSNSNGSSSGHGRTQGATSPLVLVSTDAAARGIDVPDVSHVIQADFALNAVDFLHRVGRTARAGKAGKATNLYSVADEVRASALMDHIQRGLPIEACFSRNRSLTRKVKKYGKFVARGEAGEAPVAVGAESR